MLVELRDGDLVGRGEAAPNVRYGESAETVTEALGKLAPVLEGDPRHFRVLSERIEEALPGNHAAKAALDIALHDLAGKRLGAPLYRLLGLDPARMPVTSFSIGIDDPESMARKVREAEPFPILKVKLGAQSVRELFGAVRSATPKPVRVDANEAWSPEEALKHIEWMATQGVELVEQPLPAADVEGAKWLRQRSPLPLVADEALMMASDVPKLAEGYHGINVKLQKCGGIREALRIIETARACGLKIMLGCMVETSLGIAAAAHLGPLVDWLDLDGNLLISGGPLPWAPGGGRAHPLWVRDPGSAWSPSPSRDGAAHPEPHGGAHGAAHRAGAAVPRRATPGGRAPLQGPAHARARLLRAHAALEHGRHPAPSPTSTASCRRTCCRRVWCSRCCPWTCRPSRGWGATRWCSSWRGRRASSSAGLSRTWRWAGWCRRSSESRPGRGWRRSAARGSAAVPTSWPSARASARTTTRLSMMVVVDVGVSNMWTAVLLYVRGP